jgi:hypothetical protein
MILYVVQVRIKGQEPEVEFGLSDIDIKDPVRLHNMFNTEIAKLEVNGETF